MTQINTPLPIVEIKPISVSDATTAFLADLAQMFVDRKIQSVESAQTFLNAVNTDAIASTIVGTNSNLAGK